MTLKDWLTRLAETERPPSDIVAFHFGLFEGDDDTCSIFLVGAREFSDDDDDWVANDDWLAKAKALELPAGDPEKVTEDVAETIGDFLESGRSFLHSAKAITVGFEDGDLLRIR